MGHKVNLASSTLFAGLLAAAVFLVAPGVALASEGDDAVKDAPATYSQAADSSSAADNAAANGASASAATEAVQGGQDATAAQANASAIDDAQQVQAGMRSEGASATATTSTPDAEQFSVAYDAAGGLWTAGSHPDSEKTYGGGRS